MYFRTHVSKKLLSKRKQHWFTLHGNNGEIVATSERYYNRQDMKDTIYRIKSGTMLAQIVEDDVP